MMFTIPAARLPELNKALKRVAKRAETLGVDAPGITLAPVRVHGDETGRGVAVVDVTVEGDKTLAFKGWSLITRIHHIDGAWIAAPAADPIPDRFRGRCVCDHCHAPRKRALTYLVKDGEGVIKQVGSTCLALYLGEKTAATILLEADALEILRGAAEPGEGLALSGDYSHRERVVARAVYLYERDGAFLSRARFQSGCHAATVLADLAIPELPITEAHVEIARKALEWAAAIPATTTNEYLYNLKEIATLEWWPSKVIGLGVSLYNAFKRDTAQAEEAPSVALPGTSAGDKFEGLEVTVTARAVYEGTYDTGLRINFRAGGSDLVWFTGLGALPGVEVGHTVKISGSVKDHRPYKGGVSTHINRVKLTPPPKAKKAKKVEESQDVAPF